MSQYKITSPCIGECKLNQDKVCQGCYRTSEQIENWFLMPMPERQLIIDSVLPKIIADRKTHQS